ncbi:MAG: peptide deformylase [Rhodospirillales bacterium]|nr:peptide deformylase [Rhodospirillales bacterium]
MTLLKIARMGHPVLRQRAREITDPMAPEIRHLVNDMIETMVDADGAGLAAPQVHVGLRLVIFKAPPDRAPAVEYGEQAKPPENDGEEASGTIDLTILINPDYEPLSDEKTLGWEGCLSVPGLNGAVPRYTHIRYSGVDLDGNRIEREATGFHARVAQHEIDHLDGLLYPMRMTDLSLLTFNEELKHFMRPTDEDETP